MPTLRDALAPTDSFARRHHGDDAAETALLERAGDEVARGGVLADPRDVPVAVRVDLIGGCGVAAEEQEHGGPPGSGGVGRH